MASATDDAPKVCSITRWGGRNGNNLVQLTKCLYYAVKRGYSIVSFPRHHLLTTTTMTVEPEAGVETATKDVASDFFYAQDLMGLREPCVGRLREIAQRYVVPILTFTVPSAESSGHTIAVHVRSGDVFGARPHPSYAQPPLDYYRVAIGDCRDVIVVYEDTANPCVEPLRALYASQSSSLIEDLTTLCRAHTLVAGFGTFWLMVFFLSRRLKRVVIPDYAAFMCPTTGDVAVACVPLPGYIRGGEWQNTPAQRDIMLAYAVPRGTDLVTHHDPRTEARDDVPE